MTKTKHRGQTPGTKYVSERENPGTKCQFNVTEIKYRGRKFRRQILREEMSEKKIQAMKSQVTKKVIGDESSGGI